MSTFNIKLPDTSDSLHMKVLDTTDSVHVKLPDDPTPIKKLTSGGENQTFFNYNVVGWALLPDASPMPSAEVNSAAYNPAGSLLAIGMSAVPTLIIYDAAILTSIPGPSAPSTAITNVIFNKTGTLLALSSESKIYIYDTSDWSSVIELTLPAQVETIDFNYAGTLLAAGVSGFGGDYLFIYNTSDWLRTTGPLVEDLPEGAVTTLDFSPDDTLLAVGNDFGSTRNLTVYNTATWSKIIPAGPTTDIALQCIFNNAQTELLLVKGSADYFVRWNTSTWQIIGGTPVLPAQPPCIAINENDSYVAIGFVKNATATLLVYDASTWGLESIPPTPNNRINTVDFQPG